MFLKPDVGNKDNKVRHIELKIRCLKKNKRQWCFKLAKVLYRARFTLFHMETQIVTQ